MLSRKTNQHYMNIFNSNKKNKYKKTRKNTAAIFVYFVPVSIIATNTSCRAWSQWNIFINSRSMI
jgi:hypothetical protein